MKLWLRCVWFIVLCPFASAQPRFERMAALHETVVSVHEASGIAGMFTYNHDPQFWLEYLALGKLLVGVREGSETRWLHQAKDLQVRNIPAGEGVEALGTVAGKRVHVQVLPTARGRDTQRWEGCALFLVTCEPNARLILRYGGIGRVRIHGFRPQLPQRVDYLTQADFLPTPAEAYEVDIQTWGAVLRTREIPLFVAVSVDRERSARLFQDGAFMRVEYHAPRSRATLVASFAESREGAIALVRVHPGNVEQECRQRFRHLRASAWIQTPSRELNDAFHWAIIHMEYAWVRPFGWIEGLRHWGTFYSQQHNMAADWIGQAPRSREMLLTHAVHLLPGGQVPQLHPNGQTRLDFGGWNQFYVWGVEHYWQHTGDRDFLQRILPALERVVQQTFEEHDPDGNGLLGFGQQIGNQEDYISTPEDGTSPTIAGMEMKRILGRMLLAAGRTREAEACYAERRRMWQALRKHLWMPELGRFAFYRDSLGVLHLEGQYHTLIWPVLYCPLTVTEKYTSMRHLADTLTGEEGQVYCSNNFPHHVMATVGSQAGGQPQPWATLAWADLGDGDRAVRPLEWIARRVMQSPNSGSWPEVAEEVPAYFTPPAGVFVWGVIEGLFGLKRDIPGRWIQVAPCLPKDWNYAELHLPDIRLVVKQDSTSIRILLRQEKPLVARFRIHIPPSRRVWVTGAAGYRIEPAIRGHTVTFSAAKAKRADVVVRWEPQPVDVSGGSTVPTGGLFHLRLYKPVRKASYHGGSDVAMLKRLLDPLHVLQGESWETGGSGFYSPMRETLSPCPNDYGQVGRRLFSRRTVFVGCSFGKGEGKEFFLPVDFEVRDPDAPTPAEMVKDGKLWKLRYSLRKESTLTLTRAELARLTPGINSLKLPPTRHESNETVLRFDARPLYDSADWLALARACVRHVPLPAEMMSPDTEWRTWRVWFAYGHPPWNGLQPPLQGLENVPLLEPPCVPGVSFLNPGRKAVVVSRTIGRPSVTFPLSGKGRKVYLLVIPLLDNHDVFAPVARVSVQCADGTLFSRTLHFPGDIGWWTPRRIVGDFATYGSEWQSPLSWEAPSCVMNVVDLDLGTERGLLSVMVETIGRYPALAVVGASVWGSPALSATGRLPESAQQVLALQPRTLFVFDALSLENWEIKGTAWGIADTVGDPWDRRGTSRYFANSMAGGEQATGEILSPPFRISGSRLIFLSNGHGARNYFALVDAQTGEELRRAPAPNRTGVFVKNEWDVSDFKGRVVRFKAVDAEDGSAYAWIGFDDIVEMP